MICLRAFLFEKRDEQEWDAERQKFNGSGLDIMSFGLDVSSARIQLKKQNDLYVGDSCFVLKILFGHCLLPKSLRCIMLTTMNYVGMCSLEIGRKSETHVYSDSELCLTYERVV